MPMPVKGISGLGNNRLPAGLLEIDQCIVRALHIEVQSSQGCCNIAAHRSASAMAFK